MIMKYNKENGNPHVKINYCDKRLKIVNIIIKILIYSFFAVCIIGLIILIKYYRGVA